MPDRRCPWAEDGQRDRRKAGQAGSISMREGATGAPTAFTPTCITEGRSICRVVMLECGAWATFPLPNAARANCYVYRSIRFIAMTRSIARSRARSALSTLDNVREATSEGRRSVMTAIPPARSTRMVSQLGCIDLSEKTFQLRNVRPDKATRVCPAGSRQDEVCVRSADCDAGTHRFDDGNSPTDRKGIEIELRSNLPEFKGKRFHRTGIAKAARPTVPREKLLQNE